MINASLRNKLKARVAKNPRKRPLTQEQIAALLERCAYGEPIAQIAISLGVSKQTVWYHVRKAIQE